MFIIVKILKKVLLYFMAISLFWVLLYRFVNPPITFLMIQRGFERQSANKTWKIDYRWVDEEDIAKNMRRAVVAAEDQRFYTHFGFDLNAITKAIEKNMRSKKVRGGSTISQQTAKNVFLWPGRSWIRKGFEAYFTLLIELLWSKDRIMEVYLNVIEMGDGIYGVEAASQYYFDKPARKLTKNQAALIAAVLPNPLRWTPKKPGRYIQHKKDVIVRLMRKVRMR